MLRCEKIDCPGGNMKRVLLSVLMACAVGAASSASAATFVGYSPYPSSGVNGPAKAASDAFRASLARYSVEDFESLALNSAAPLPLTFEGSYGSIAASYTGDGMIRTRHNGAYPTSGTRDILTYGSGTLTFAQPVGAFGLYVTDASDYRYPLYLDVYTGTGSPTTYVVSDGTSAPNGTLRFFGVTSPVAITSIAFRGPGQWDSFGYDDMVVGSMGVPEPATWALMMLGFGAIAGALRRRRPAPQTA